MKLRWSAMMLAVLLWAGFVGAGFAQSTNSGDIRGIVTDASGAAIPGVTVTVLNKNTGVSREYTTNQDGLYDTSSVVAGTYSLTFTRQGFQKFVRSTVTVQVGTTNVNAKLQVGSVTQEVVVSTDVPLLKTEGGDQTTTLEAKTMSELPQVGQDWQNFTILLPGASGAPGGSQGASNPGQVASVNGNLPYSTVLADGAAVTLPSSANADVMVLEDVQELQVSASAFSAQYGVGGIMFNQISKGGTDSFHGSVYEYAQNDAFNAANYAFSVKTRQKALSKVRYNNFGFSVGGPILKKKVFFFFNYDKIINHGAASTGSTTVPDAGARNGDFTGPGYLTIYDPATTVLTQATGTRPLPSDPTKTQTCPCYDRTSFADEYGNGNRIPASRIDPLAKAIQAYYPTANQTPSSFVNGVGKNNFFYNVPNSAPFTKYFGRLDYNITANNRLTLSETESDNPGYSNGQGNCPINCQSQDVSRHNAQITDVWTISPNTINELRLGYTNQLNFFVPASLGKGFPAKLGWQYAKADVFPNVNVSGYYGLASSTNAVYKEHAYDPSDVVTMIRGKHILHFGGEFLFYRDNSTAWGNLNAGTMGFGSKYAYTQETVGDNSSGLAYADFLLGQTQSWSASETPEYGARMRLPQMFVQDDWKVLPNLTLNLGLRYQIQSGWGEVKGNMSTFDPTLPNPASGTLGAMWYGSTHGGTLQKPVYNTFLPRFGFAWQFDPKSTVRGGFGLYAYNWSLDTYGGGMGGAFGQKGNATDQTNGVTPVLILSSSGSNLPYIAATTDPSKFNGQGVGYTPYNTPVGGSYQWNLSVQREVSNNMAVELAYVASHGHDLPWNADINQIPEDKLGPNDVALGYRPYPQYAGISGYVAHNAISNYNSLQASIQKRLTHGLEFNFNYVWAHFLDEMDSSGWGSRAGGQAYQNAYNPSLNYGNSNFDVRNALKGNVVYQLPFGRGRQFLNNNWLLDEIVGGWQASGTLVAQSGQPFTVTMAKNNSYAQAGSWYPNVIGKAHLSSHGQYHGTKQWFNEAAFAAPTDGTFGNSHRNSLNGPGLSNVNLSLGKSFAIWEQVHIQVRADAQNIFNHPSFSLPGSSLSLCPTKPAKPGDQPPAGCTAFNGAVQTGSSTINGVTIGGRKMQIGARLSF